MTAKKKPAKPAAKRPRGRPSTYDPAKAAAICDRLSKGEPLAVICRDKGMPPVRTVSQWKEDHRDFAADFARARDEGYDAIAAECLGIADDARNDFMEKLVGTGGDGEPIKAVQYDAEHVQRSKLRIETRLKLLAKWDPRRYGEKMTAELTGKDGKDLPVVPAGVLVVPGLMADAASWARAAQAACLKGE